MMFSLVSIAVFGSGCEELKEVTQAQNTCEAGTAQIAVWDGFLQTVCGCGGTDGALVPAGTSLSCTFSLGKTLFIYFHGKLRHQLVPVGSPALPATTLYNPTENLPIATFATTPSAAGSYSFQDQFESGLSGTITVTP